MGNWQISAESSNPNEPEPSKNITKTRNDPSTIVPTYGAGENTKKKKEEYYFVFSWLISASGGAIKCRRSAWRAKILQGPKKE